MTTAGTAPSPPACAAAGGDLTLARDPEAEDEVNVSWAVTDASAWGLGPNACGTPFVGVQDDGDLHAGALRLGATETAFDGIETGTEVAVRLAIGGDHADGDQVVRDILEQTLNQGVAAPSFTTGFLRVTTLDDTGTPNVNEFATGTVPLGVMDCAGCNGNFGNGRAHGLLPRPDTPRFRRGLAHADKETDNRRSDMDFAACVLRIADAGGDRVVPRDMATVASHDGTRKPVAGQADDARAAHTVPFGNVRINEGGRISAAMQDRTEARVCFTRGPMYPGDAPLSPIGARTLNTDTPGDVFAEPPHEHRDRAAGNMRQAHSIRRHNLSAPQNGTAARGSAMPGHGSTSAGPRRPPCSPPRSGTGTPGAVWAVGPGT